MGRMTYVKALMCLLFPSAALVARAQHPVAGDLKCKLTGRMLMDGGVLPLAMITLMPALATS